MVFKGSEGYSFAPGSRHKVDPNVAGKVCEELESKGELTAKKLVDVSRPADAPLHCEFEWDDSKAAELYREEQGRALIRHLVVIRPDPEKESKKDVERMFFHVPSEERYMNVNTIVRRPDALDSLKKQALREMITFKAKYKKIYALEPVFNEMEKAIAKLSKQDRQAV